jgi:uncharacterized protein (DUF58 family)
MNQVPAHNQAKLLEQAKYLGLRALTLVEGLRVGDQKSPTRGFSVEFAQHREYVPGDDLRHIDWRGYARTEKYIVKQYEQETNYTAHVLLDLSGSMSYGAAGKSKHEMAQLLATVLCQIAASQGDAVGLKTIDSPSHPERLLSFTPSTKSNRLKILLNQVTALVPGPEREQENTPPLVSAALRQISERQIRKGMVIVISDFLEPWPLLLKEIFEIRARGHDLLLVQVLHGDEIDFPLEGQILFEDLESSGSLVTRPQLLRSTYQKEIKTWLDEIDVSCTRLQATHLLIRSDKPPEDELLKMLALRLMKKRVSKIQ